VSDRIAIVGYDVCLPAGRDRAEIDSFLESQKSAVVDVSRSEMLAAGVPEPVFTRDGYVARSARAEWTPQTARHLQGVTAHELTVTDPQHLLFLDCCIGALHDAGMSPERVRGQEIGVVGGIGMGLYAGHSLDSHFTTRIQRNITLQRQLVFPETLIGNSSDHCIGRVSYRLGLTGPSVNVQTACSTALAAVDVAVLLLRSGRADTVLAGAAALYFPDRRGYQWERGGILSPTGVCRAFDAQADGTVGGSGGGVFVLRRYTDAVADGNVIHGVIEGIHSASDGGQRASYAAPAFDGQVRVIRRAMADAGVGPEDIAYVEGHGTGTTVGDLVELAALHEVFGERDTHLDTAAGVASLVNVLLGLKRGWLPPTANFSELSTDARDWIAQPSATPTPLPQGTSMIGISGFGASGTSVHLVVSGERDPELWATAPPERGSVVAGDVTPPTSPNRAAYEDESTAHDGDGPERRPTREEITGVLIGLLRERGDFAHLSDQQLLEVGVLDFGIDSMDMMAVTNVLEARWGVRLEVLDLFTADTVAEIIELIEQDLAE
jgi:acyl transferase domain-containing protein/acyl carrier protein